MYNSDISCKGKSGRWIGSSRARMLCRSRSLFSLFFTFVRHSDVSSKIAHEAQRSTPAASPTLIPNQFTSSFSVSLLLLPFSYHVPLPNRKYVVRDRCLCQLSALVRISAMLRSDWIHTNIMIPAATVSLIL